MLVFGVLYPPNKLNRQGGPLKSTSSYPHESTMIFKSCALGQRVNVSRTAFFFVSVLNMLDPEILEFWGSSEKTGERPT